MTGNQQSVEYEIARRAKAAFLGAAVGDALGWPHERRPRRSSLHQADALLRYKEWTKRSGGRFQAYEEHIAAGSYSDDTQLILAVSRSIRQNGSRWWESFALQELPFWTIYERGGGSATKRAAMSWAQGCEPWQRQSDALRYFEAGGNGVAMRILPHVTRYGGERDFSDIAVDVLTDGVCTHGHPRALIGALVYAFALWRALRNKETLGFGQILYECIDSSRLWHRLPSIDQRWADWKSTAISFYNFEEIWTKTVDEQMHLLAHAADAIAAGSASFDDETLERIGCFDRSVKGAGTVTAAAAIYLASRHAADPHEGMRVAALAYGADTDTLASMTAALLGAAVGANWLDQYFKQLQDFNSIVQTADYIVSGKEGKAEPVPVTRNKIATFVASLEKLQSKRISLPIGIDSTVRPWKEIVSKVKSTTASGWIVSSDDGQTFFVKVFNHEKMLPSTKTLDFNLEAPQIQNEFSIGIRIGVKDIMRSRLFYNVVLGLPASREVPGSISFGKLAITEGNVSSNNPRFRLYIQVSNIKQCFDRAKKDGVLITVPITSNGSRRHFRCMDPDGYDVELYETIK